MIVMTIAMMLVMMMLPMTLVVANVTPDTYVTVDHATFESILLNETQNVTIGSRSHHPSYFIYNETAMLILVERNDSVSSSFRPCGTSDDDPNVPYSLHWYDMTTKRCGDSLSLNITTSFEIFKDFHFASCDGDRIAIVYTTVSTDSAQSVHVVMEKYDRMHMDSSTPLARYKSQAPFSSTEFSLHGIQYSRDCKSVTAYGSSGDNLIFLVTEGTKNVRLQTWNMNQTFHIDSVSVYDEETLFLVGTLSNGYGFIVKFHALKADVGQLPFTWNSVERTISPSQIANTDDYLYISYVVTADSELYIGNRSVLPLPVQSPTQVVAAIRLSDSDLVWHQVFSGGISNSTISLHTLEDSVYYTVSFAHKTTMRDDGLNGPISLQSSNPSIPYTTHLFR